VSQVNVSLKVLLNSNKQFITNLYQWDACCLFNIVPLNDTNTLVVASQRLWFSVSSAIRFLFLDLTCFMIENVPIFTGYCLEALYRLV